MTRDNLYWLSHDQVALFKTFRGTASRCKQTINHAVPRIKQSNSLLYDILLHCKNRSRIHPKIWLPVSILKYPQYWNPVPTLVPILSCGDSIMFSILPSSRLHVW
ncbi:hypothetical protein Lal_00021861 [Lupinus albus]|nr:hypothetical protein Lal_00021861 [Lupinus albus]